MSGARNVTIAVIQCPLDDHREANVARVERLVRRAAKAEAQVVLPPELFEGPYFPRQERSQPFAWARPLVGNPTLERFAGVARELQVVIPVSFFERAGQAFYNTVAVLDADGSVLGAYRKSHIPDGPGYQEKYYFRPGDTGFRVFSTRYGRFGVGICWDQWFPECARAMALLGAELLLYPTAIGSEPDGSDTRDPWRRAMVGHAVSNAMPIATANRVGHEGDQVFYGSSFVANHRGDIVADLDRAEAGLALATLDLAAADRYRANWGFFRDRRPDLYGVLTTADGACGQKTDYPDR